MSKNPNALQWEEKVVNDKRNAGRSWNRIIDDFRRLNNFAGMAIAMRLAKQERAQQLAAFAI